MMLHALKMIVAEVNARVTKGPKLRLVKRDVTTWGVYLDDGLKYNMNLHVNGL